MIIRNKLNVVLYENIEESIAIIEGDITCSLQLEMVEHEREGKAKSERLTSELHSLSSGWKNVDIIRKVRAWGALQHTLHTTLQAGLRPH